MDWGFLGMCVGRERTRRQKDKSTCRRQEVMDGTKSREWCDKLGWGQDMVKQSRESCSLSLMKGSLIILVSLATNPVAKGFHVLSYVGGKAMW